MNIRLTPPAFENAGGGCGDPHCDYQVQCDPCWTASLMQYEAWFKRAGHRRSMFSLVIDQMHEDAHSEALKEARKRAEAKLAEAKKRAAVQS